MVAPTVSSRALTRPNWYARVSVLVGVLALAVAPAAIAASQRVPRVTLLEAVGAIAASGLLALLALLLARRARLYRERTLGRAGGARLVHLGRMLGLIGTCLAASACIALAFYVALRVFLS